MLIFRAEIKIYGVLCGICAQERVDVVVQLNIQMILIYRDLPDYQFKVGALQLVFFNNVAEYVQRSLRDPVDLNDGVALIGEKVDLMTDALVIGSQQDKKVIDAEIIRAAVDNQGLY